MKCKDSKTKVLCLSRESEAWIKQREASGTKEVKTVEVLQENQKCREVIGKQIRKSKILQVEKIPKPI